MRKIFNGMWYELRPTGTYSSECYNSHYWHNTGMKA